jgi:hypothetical protein
MTTLPQTQRRVYDRAFLKPGGMVAKSGPCRGHVCDECETCKGGTCCGTLPLRAVDREGNPALSPKPTT